MSERTLLQTKMRYVLHRMSLLSEQKARSYDGEMVHTNVRDMSPAGLVEEPLVDEFRRRWEGARSLKAKREVVEAAETALRGAKWAPNKTEETVGTVDWRKAVADDPRPADVVAGIYNISRVYVYKLRQQMREDAA